MLSRISKSVAWDPRLDASQVSESLLSLHLCVENPRNPLDYLIAEVPNKVLSQMTGTDVFNDLNRERT